MKELKKILYVGLVIAIAGLMCLQAGANTTLVNGNHEKLPNAQRIYKEVPIKKIESKNQNILSKGGNVRISFDSDGDFSKPCITKDGSGRIIVAMTEELGPLDIRLAWSYSEDGGETWESIGWTEPTVNMFNDIAWEDNQVYTGLLGVFGDLATNTENFYFVPDITDSGTWLFYYWTNERVELTDMNIEDNSFLEGQYNDLDGPMYTSIQHLISPPYDIVDCPNQMIIGMDEEGEILGGESTFDGQGGPGGTGEFLTAPAEDIDSSNELMKSHHVWQYNDPEGAPKIVYKKIIPIDGDTDSCDIEFTPYQQYLGEGEHPTIAHFGDTVAAVYMSNGNVVCSYSSDDGTTFETTTIGTGTFPAICNVGTQFRCAYANEGNLYMVISDDGGATWGDPVQINDNDGSVVEMANAIDINAAGVVWIDNREGSNSIYFGTGGAANPVIEIASVSGGLGVSAVIQNTGNADAVGLEWRIFIDAPLMLLGKETMDTVDIPAGSDATITSGFILGFGQATITVTAGDVSEEISKFVIGPFVL
jgi:hypothetical protein